MRLLVLALVTAAAIGCTPSKVEETPGRVVYSITPIADAPSFFHVRVRIESAHRVLSSPSVVVPSEQWAHCFVAEGRGGIVVDHPPGGEPALRKASIWLRGVFIVVRCETAPDGRITAKVRAYSIREGEVVWSRKADDVPVDGHERPL